MAEPKATPQMPRLRPWGFPTVSPSHPSLFPHHGIRRITVEFSEDSRSGGRIADHEIHGSRLITATSGIVAGIMIREIRPLVLDDLSAVGRFLIAGFPAAPDADFLAPEVLRWKYLEPRGEDYEAPRSYLAREEGGHVIGHVGICRTAFEHINGGDRSLQRRG